LLVCKLFIALSSILIIINFLHNYFNDSTKLFLDLHLTKFLETSAKTIFFCNYMRTSTKMNFIRINLQINRANKNGIILLQKNF